MDKRIFLDGTALTDDNSYYLGDSVYGYIDKKNRAWVLTCNGYSVENAICLEPEVFDVLMWFWQNKERWFMGNKNEN